MAMKRLLYEINHATRYEYHGSVSLAHHLVHLSPRPTPRQLCLSQTLAIDPVPGTLTTRADYFGNAASLFTIAAAHKHLEVVFRSRVAVAPAFVPESSESPPWESVRGLCRGDRSGFSLEAMEFVHDSPRVGIDAAYASYAAPSFAPGRPVMDAVMDLARRIHADFAFDPKATSVSTTVEEFFQARRGVCQDFAHLQIACLRSLGLPARYVSGYLETDPPPGQTKLVGSDASHAWVAFFCPGVGWIDVDPTNNCLPSLRHITVAWGRDYGDVSPLRGVLLGSGKHVLAVSVDVNALGPFDEGETEQTPS
jgi:transglutaminase-like putative cysteine protease